MRIEILPRLAELNPGAEAALARAARIQRLDGALLDCLAEGEAARLLREADGTIRFSMSALREPARGLLPVEWCGSRCFRWTRANPGVGRDEAVLAFVVAGVLDLGP